VTSQHSSSRSQQFRGAAFGLGAAALFGLSAPTAKLLLADVSPVLLAGLLYLGAAVGLWVHRAIVPQTREAALRRTDLPKLASVVLAGGVAGPVLMLFGLARVSGLTGSLLLNLEAPFTMLLAVLVFREHLGRHGLTAVALILTGALVLKLEPGTLRADTLGVILLAAACACWALDNNLTQRLSLRDPFAIVRVKTLAAGLANTVVGLWLVRSALPSGRYVAAALVLGSLSYGLSVVLDAYALRLVGAAREAAYFATAPFVGALASLVLLGEVLRPFDVLAMFVMVLGVVFLLRERHAHGHMHEALEHEHLHSHDEHHRHEHVAGDPPGEPHSHFHRHAPLFHDHPHVPDAHHRHRH
jgi:drug/metabolite transporter (DMT)-like permease